MKGYANNEKNHDGIGTVHSAFGRMGYSYKGSVLQRRLKIGHPRPAICYSCPCAFYEHLVSKQQLFLLYFLYPALIYPYRIFGGEGCHAYRSRD